MVTVVGVVTVVVVTGVISVVTLVTDVVATSVTFLVTVSVLLFAEPLASVTVSTTVVDPGVSTTLVVVVPFELLLVTVGVPGAVDTTVGDPLPLPPPPLLLPLKDATDNVPVYPPAVPFTVPPLAS